MPTRAKQAKETGLRLVAAVVGLLATCAFATDSRSVAPSPYQLSIAFAESSRLVDLAQYRLTSPRNASAEMLSAQPYAAQIDVAAREAGLDPALLHALIHVESRYQAKAVSPKGAMGLMQVMPGTGARFGIPRPDQSVEANLKAGSHYLRALMRQFDGRLELVLAAYNAGEGAVLKHSMTVPPYPETRRYVPAVLKKYEAWRTDRHVVRAIEYLPGTRLTSLR